MEFEGEAEGSYLPGAPAVMYLRNGDPGYPADPPEFEIDEARILKIDNVLLPSPLELDGKGIQELFDNHYDHLLQKAIDTYDGGEE
jgi:hypothetical protein